MTEVRALLTTSRKNADITASHPSFAAVILAAGKSSRIGQAKAFIELEHEPLVARLARLAQAAGALPTIIVAGAAQATPGLADVSHMQQVISQVLPKPKASELVFVMGQPDGQFIDSLRLALPHVKRGQGLLLWPVDHPFADANLLKRLVSAAQSNQIAIPVVDKIYGHPVFLGSEIVPELMAQDLKEGARSVTLRDITRIVTVEAFDKRVVEDVDTLTDALRLGLTLK